MRDPMKAVNRLLDVHKENRKKEEGVKRMHGYEVPDDTSDEAGNALKALSENGVIYYRNDDGPGLLVREELLDIAGSIGLMVFYFERPSHYQLVLFDDDGATKYLVEHS